MPGFETQPLSLAHSGADSTKEYTELFRDPLGEFLPESRPVGGSTRLISIEPAVPMSVEDPWTGPYTRRREPKGRWFIGWMMLGVGLMAGFVAGMAVLWNSLGDTPVTPASPSNLATAEHGNNDVPVRPSPPPPLEESADRQRAARVDDLSREERNPSTTAGMSAGGTQRAPKPEVAASAVERVGPGLFVQSSPSGAAVYLDGQLISTTPFQLPEIAPGTYTIRIAQPGYREWSASVEVQPGAGTRISASLEPEQILK